MSFIVSPQMKLRKLAGGKRKKDNFAVTDLTFLVIFPLLFLVFNLLYWTAVLWTRRLEENLIFSKQR